MWEAEAGRLLGGHSEFEAILGCSVIPYFKTKQNRNKQTKPKTEINATTGERVWGEGGRESKQEKESGRA